MFGQIPANEQSVVWLLAIAVAGVVAIYAAIKIAHFILKLAFGLIGLALVAGAVWWFFLRH